MANVARRRNAVTRNAVTGEVVRVKLKNAPVAPGNVLVHVGKLLDQKVRSDADVVRLVVNGLPARSLTRLATKVRGAGKLVAPGTTVRRRLKDDERFSVGESERMVRLARVYALAVEVFGEEARAEAWLERSLEYLPGQASQSPLELAVTDPGARMVEGMLLKTQHGLF